MQRDRGLVRIAVSLALGSSMLLTGCSKKQEPTPAPPPEPARTETEPAKPASAPEQSAQAEAEPEAKGKPRRALALALSRFSGSTPQPARVELLVPQKGLWKSIGFDDPDSNVFHKALALSMPGEPPALITLGGMKAMVKAWRPESGSFRSETLWSEAFGGKFDRMRDAEIGDVNGDGKPEIVVGTHDQGVVAYLVQKGGKWTVERLDREPNTFIHEIELGDLDGDGTLEVYATPSEPNRLDAGEQSGRVVRYVPKKKDKGKVVADLGKRHAKEILVTDLEGDGRDELYVAVEALTKGDRNNVQIVEPVEIRRYDADTPPDEGKVVARIDDRYCRFLTAGDLDGDGKKELVAAAFRSGVWLIKPSREPGKPWRIENIEPSSSGFEHAALMTDLDGDGRDELYVAADDQGELRRYVYRDGKKERETILKRENPRETWTWNIMPIPMELTGL